MRFNIFKHYYKLWYFTFNRFKGNNYQLMREYFTDILIMDLEKFMSLDSKKVLDIGGATGTFCRTLNEKKGCDAINLDPAPGKYNPEEPVWSKTVVGGAEELPFAENEFDFVMCRAVMEHIPSDKQQRCVDEMYRVIRPGGFGYILIPPWYSPHAGHRLRPFHLLPFKWAKFLRQLIFRNRIEETSYEQCSLYPITFRKMATMIRRSGFDILATKDSHFRLHFLTRIPIVREIAIPAVTFICKKETT